MVTVNRSCCWHRRRRRRTPLAFAGGVACCLATVLACAPIAPKLANAQQMSLQDLVAAARPRIASRQGLLVALRQALRASAITDIDAGLIATLGEPVTSWSLEIVEDDRSDDDLRVAAMLVLSYARPRYAVEPLKRLAVPDQGSVLLWAGAMSALQSFPYPEAADFWRSLLRHPRIGVRLSAMTGLARSGSPADVPLILGVEGASEAARSEAVARIDGAAAGRGDPVLGPPTPDGRFVPTAAWVNQNVRAYLCVRVRCQ